jgi:anti-sigma B factor antagonist
VQAQGFTPLRIELSQSPAGEVTAKLAGEFDMAAEAAFAEAITKGIARNGHWTVAVDCSQVTFIDSSGLRALIAAQKQAELCGTAFVLVAPSDAVAWVLQIAGLLDHFTIVPAAGQLDG